MTYDEFLAKVEKGKNKPSTTRQTENINKDACRSVLAGAARSLILAFSWESTPQGTGYWDSRYDGDEELSDDDLEFIRGLIS